ncbi:MAG: SusC/RagA family TonB-linked outer membrane protein, partial [Rikenellaceae bacterium]
MKQNLPMMYATVLLSLLSFHPTICSAGGIEISQEIETRSDDQSVKRTITVKDASGAAITGAIVKNDASGKAAITDINGSAMVAANDGEKISVDFMGYKTHTLTASVADTYLVILETDELLVDEVVVVGYGVQKKVNLTGSVSQVEMDKVLGDRPVTSVTNALQGSIPGLQITGNSAQPGKNQSINIRGTTSINGGGPLILIDNVPGDINMINPEDIESISVLKDAASTAIYGARGAFGVMLITTKKAKNDTKLSINYNNNFGFSKSLNVTESASLENFLNSYLDAEFGGKKYWTGQDIPTWLSLAEEYRTNPEAMLQKGHFIGSEKDTYVLNGTDADVAANRYYFFENNQQKKMLDNFGFQQIHNVSASGGSKNIAYRIAMGYMSNNGVLKTNKDSESRTNVSSYVNADITNWFSTSLDLKYAKSKIKEPYASNIWSANESSYQPQGIIPFNGEEYLADTRENRLKYSPIINRTANDTRIYSRSSIHPLKGLEAIFEYTYNGVDNDMTQNNVIETFVPISLSPGNNTQTQYWNNKSNSDYNALNAYVAYQFDINKSHNFKIMAGFAQEQRVYKALNVTRKDLINPSLPSINGSTGEIISTDDYKEYIIRGGYFRVNYDY